MCRSPEGKVNQPKSISKDIGLAVDTLSGNGVQLAQDIRMAEICEVLGALDV